MLNWDDPLTPKTAEKPAKPASAGTPAPKAPAPQPAETARSSGLQPIAVRTPAMAWPLFWMPDCR